MRRVVLVPFVIAFGLSLLGTAAQAAEITSVQPACGAPGDLVAVHGSGFGALPEVRFGDTAAAVVRARADALLCRVPAGLAASSVALTVNGARAEGAFAVLAAGMPVVYRTSAAVGTRGQPLWVYGLRLGGATIAFVDERGAVQADADLEGRERVGVVRVPESLPLGVYVLVLTNAAGLDSGCSSPTFEVVERGAPTLVAIRPEEASPGSPVTLEGRDLGPPGPCRVTWTDAYGRRVDAAGFSNGYDEVRSFVPAGLAPQSWHEVTVTPRGETTTPVFAYETGVRPAPQIEALSPDAGAAGSPFMVLGRHLLAKGERSVVTFSAGSASVEAQVILFHARLLGGISALLAVVPEGLLDGPYDVTVAVGEQTSQAATFSVGRLPLTVASLSPSERRLEDVAGPVAIEGTGFGSQGIGPTIQVLWDDGRVRREGVIQYRSDRLLLVYPPGATADPLPQGTYVVYVVLDPDGESVTVEAGTYQVW